MTSRSANLRVAFRTDAAIEIGTGHVMRCLTLATALAARGAECVFLCRPHDGHLLDFIAAQGFRAVALPALATVNAETEGPPHASWLGTGWAEDARDSQQALADWVVGGALDWLIVDHYALESRWETAMRPMCSRILVIDDLADRQHDCDLLLDQSLGRVSADYAGLVPSAATLLLGPQYALLRPEFARLRAASLARRAQPKLRKLLVTVGGVDKDNATGKVLDAIAGCALPADVEILVVMGQQAPWLDQVRNQAAAMRFATEVRVNVRNMGDVMTNSDLAIGAAGTTTWERCSLGLPSVIVETAANQAGIAQAIVATGAGLPTAPVQTPEFAVSLLAALTAAADPARLKVLSQAAAAVCDGDGVARAIALLCPSSRGFRDATRADSRRIWEWRLATNAAFKLASEETPFAVHDDWFVSALQQSNRVIRVLMLGDLPCGYLRLDRAGALFARVSVCLSPSVQGKGLGKDLLVEAERLAQVLLIERLDAEIHPDNTASIRLFSSAGYKQSADFNGFLTFHRSIERLQ